jgi:hypothetical protein
MIRRKSQLEINNELLNKEMKSIFSQAKIGPPDTANEMSTNSATININANDKNNNYAYSNGHKAQDKNYVPMQTFHNESVETDSTIYNSNLVMDVYLSDDLSLLPIIDDKTLLSTLKAKFENRKYYVNVLLI